MTISEKHAEWISLLEVSGSFLAVAVLEEAFPQGLDKITTPFRQRIRSAYDEWRDAVDESDPQIDAIHREWLSLVIRDFLEHDDSILKSAADLPASLLYHDVQSDSTFRPDFAVMAGDKAKLLISVTPPNTDIENPLPSESWLASPAERLIALCRTSGVSVGLVTNGERWMVVSVPADGGSSRASWYARLWFQEPVTLQAFYSLLGVRRCFGQEDQTLEALLQKSLGHQDEITDTLGEQVRRAVEVLVQALDRADLDRNRTLLKDVTPEQLFEAGLTVMMRLVVLLCAEERGLLLLGEPVYDQNYAVSSLRSQLVQQANHGLEILERREDAWSRLLATFRGVYGGISHETLRLPPLGGSLFDPDRFPFLEGRDPGTCWRDTGALPLPIDNRTVLLLLNALQVLEHKSGAQLLSYESLDVEQIGHVYEGLLERTVKRVPDVTLGLVANSAVRKKTGHPELLLTDLEQVTNTGKDNLRDFLVNITGRSKSAITNDLSNALPQKDAHRLLTACGGDLTLTARIKPFGNLIRTDSWGDPLVYRANAFIVTHGAGRRETGSHYTPKSLTEPIVEHTLEPLAYVGPAEGKPREQWLLRTPVELLALKVCDMAMGSGAFLVQTCRWLAERLVEAWDAAEKAGRAISIEGVVFEVCDAELLPSDQAERVLIARRLIASRCLYGVDINPMAVELAKLSLWLITMMRNRPFSFLDHALKCGDSLLGVSQLKQLEHFSLRDPDHAQPLLELRDLQKHIEKAAALRRTLEAMPSHAAAQIAEKARLHAEAEMQLARLRAASDFLVASELASSDGRGGDTRRALAASNLQTGWSKEIAEFQRLARVQLNGRRPFHWALEFPEVFSAEEEDRSQTGFDAFCGNPPFKGGQRITGEFGTEYRDYLVETIAAGKRGSADLCVYFILRADNLLHPRHGRLGFIATNTIAQGDTREVGLQTLLSRGSVISGCIPSYEWPGSAAVTVTVLWIAKGLWKATRYSSLLTETSSGTEWKVFRLSENCELAFIGSQLSGEGFKLTPDQAAALISEDERNREVVFPIIRGEDVTTVPTQTARQWVINFFNFPIERAASYSSCFLQIKEKVLPERMKVKRAARRDRWWQYAERCQTLYELIADSNEVIVQPFTCKYICPSIVSARQVFSAPMVVFTSASRALFACLQSTHHASWVETNSSTIQTGQRYTPSDALETFPFPANYMELQDLLDIGTRYHTALISVMKSRDEGLTGILNRCHNPDETADDIVDLRDLHRQLDTIVTIAYGWADLTANEGAALRHDFHDTKQGIRWTLHPGVRRDILDRLLALNHKRYAEEVTAGLHEKKGGKKKSITAQLQEPEFAFEPVNPNPAPSRANPIANGSDSRRSSADVEQSELLSAIFTCAARREVTDRETLTRQVAETLGFQRLTSNLREVIASGINSAIRRGLVTYDAQNIHRVATSYAELDHEFLVKAINASIRSGCVYTADEVFHLAAEHLGCHRLKKGFREHLEFALTAASRRGILTKCGDEIRKA